LLLGVELLHCRHALNHIDLLAQMMQLVAPRTTLRGSGLGAPGQLCSQLLLRRYRPLLFTNFVLDAFQF
jgi:hypothetical protein